MPICLHYSLPKNRADYYTYSILDGLLPEALAAGVSHTVPKFTADGQPNMKFLFFSIFIGYIFIHILFYLQVYLGVHWQSTLGQ